MSQSKKLYSSAMSSDWGFVYASWTEKKSTTASVTAMESVSEKQNASETAIVFVSVRLYSNYSDYVTRSGNEFAIDCVSAKQSPSESESGS